jgi:hypothetical protein
LTVEFDFEALVEEAGPRRIGERWAADLRRRLDRLRDSHESGSAPDEFTESWEDMALYYGGDDSAPVLAPETRCELIIAAAEAANGDEDLLWCLGDMPADHLIGDDRQQGLRLHQARRDSPGVELMFQVMQRYLRECEHPMGWWADGWDPADSPK